VGRRGAFAFTGVVLALTVGCDPFVLAARDRFDGDVQNGWGTTEPGGTYKLVGAPSDFDVSDGTGRIVVRRAGSSRGAYLDDVGAGDVNLLVRVRTDEAPTGGRQYVYLTSRRTTVGEYLGKLSFHASGAVSVEATRFMAADQEEIPLVPEVRLAEVTHRPGQWFWLEVDVTGVDPTRVRVRAWADGAAAPDWTVDATDGEPALQAPGGVGVRCYLSSETDNAPTFFTFDDFQVRT
jgi:hypothetical protein